MSILPPRMRIGRALGTATPMPLIATLDEIRLTVGAGRNLSLNQSAPWPNAGELDTDSTDIGWVDITAHRDDYTDQVKRFTITKAKAGADGTVGSHNAKVFIYQRGTSAPALPSATVTFTFDSGSITGLTNGWSASVPTGTDPIYVSAATANDPGATDTIAASEWASPVLFSQNGLSSASIFLFRRNSLSTAPDAPNVSLLYTFATATLTGDLQGWSQSVPPESDGNTLYVTTATALSATGTDTIAPSEWAVVRVMAKNGSSVTGPIGPRGPVQISVALTGSAIWSDDAAVAALLAAGFGAPQALDMVTEYKQSANFSEGRFFDGTHWLPIASYLNGNMFVNGTIAGIKLLADTITTREILVGAATSAAIAGSTGNLVTGVTGGPVIDTGLQAVVSLTSTGAPVTVFASAHLQATSLNAGDGSGGGDSRQFIAQTQLYIDGVAQVGATSRYAAWSVNAEGYGQDHPSAEITMPVLWWGAPTPGTHIYQLKTTFYCVSSNGAQVVQAAPGCSYKVDYYVIAQENKV